VKEKLEDNFKVKQVMQIRPHFDEINLASENEAAVVFNTLT
jgi:hypothetical protein